MKTRARLLLQRRFTEWSAGRQRRVLAAAALLGIVFAAESADAQCAAYGGVASLSIVSGNNQSGAPGSSLPLAVSVSCADSAGTGNGEPVTWAIVSGGGTLAAATTVANAAAIATNSVTLTTSPSVTVRATAGAATVVFSATSGTSVATALAPVALNMATVQTQNIGLRLASLRGGARGLSISGVSLITPADSETPGSAMPAALADGLGRRLGLFINAEGSFGKQDTTQRELGFDYHTIGGTLGADYRITDQLILGGAIGYLKTDSDFDADGGETTAHGLSLSVFGTYYLRDVYYIDGIATYGWTWYETERLVGGAGGPSIARGDPNGNHLALSISGGRNFVVGALTLGPYARLDYVNAEVDSYSERGGGNANLRVKSQDIDSVVTALGGRVSYAISTALGVFVPTVSAEWQHEFAGDSQRVSATTIDGTSISVLTSSPDRDYFRLGAGLVATLRRGTHAFVHYDSIVGRDNFTHHGFTAGVRLDF
jgi:outer membrane lipase/esterase